MNNCRDARRIFSFRVCIGTAVSLPLAALMPISNLHAVSFDCKKASTYVEKRICEDAVRFNYGLSKLDSDLNNAYRTILKRADNPAAVKAAQRKWLKTRNRCQDPVCIENAYRERLKTIHAPLKRPATILPSNGKTTESHVFPSEADKLRVLKSILRNHKLTLHRSTRDDTYCSKFMQDLMADKVSAVEPDVRAETKYDPALEKWHRCDDKDLKDINTNDPLELFNGIGKRGEPPYLYYHIDLDGNPDNGKEDLMYHEHDGPVGHTGYTRVDLDACKLKDAAGGSGEFRLYNLKLRQTNADGLYFFNFIAKYRNEYLALTLFPTKGTAKWPGYKVEMQRFNGLQPRICVWEEFAREKPDS